MLPQLGHTLVLLAMITGCYTAGAVIVAYKVKNRAAWLESAHYSCFATWALVLGAAALLISAFLRNDFTLAYVWENSARAQPLPFKISALWGGQGGSLLLWCFILSSYALVVSIVGRKQGQELSPGAVAVIAVTTAFFAGLIAFHADPFTIVAGKVPPDGPGMNPLLQNYWMQIHPPTLYTGYVGCTVPFAFAVSALLHKRFNEAWVLVVRRWLLFTWVVLTVGIILGGIWAYETLGWGGYWAWDPVENASLLPWLTATAFLHSIMLQGRRGLLKNWNIALVTLTFLLSIFGTFLTRSGVVQSVHSFAESGIGGYFLGFLGLVLVLTLGLIWFRRDELVSDACVETPLSREGAFMLNNWLLLGATFAILWGTVYPAISEALGNGRVAVDRSYYDHFMAPLGLFLLALTGIGPLLPWRRTTWKGVWRAVRFPALWAVAFSPLMWVMAQRHVGAATSFALSFFVAIAIGWEFWRGISARRRIAREGLTEATVGLVAFNTTRYGGYIVHWGIALMFVGFTGSSVFKVELPPQILSKGQSFRIGDEYRVRFDGLYQPFKMPDNLSNQIVALVSVFDMDGHMVTSPNRPMDPHVDIFKNTGSVNAIGQSVQEARRPSIRTTPANDLYLVLDGYDVSKNHASIKAYLNPLTMWIWVSVGFFIVGTIIAMIPNRRRAPKDVVTPAVEALSEDRVRQEATV